MEEKKENDLQNKTDEMVSLNKLMLDIAKALDENHATFPMVLAAANQMIVSVIVEIAENQPKVNALSLLESVIEQIRKNVKRRFVVVPFIAGEA